MFAEIPPWVWTTAFGAVGGLVNACFTADLRLWWTTHQAATPPAVRLVRIGLLANLGIAGVFGAAAAVAIEGAGAADQGAAGRELWLALIGGVVGVLAARLVTSELDKRLLRAAVCKACAAPAAHPDAVRRLASAPTHVAYAISDDLMPRIARR